MLFVFNPAFKSINWINNSLDHIWNMISFTSSIILEEGIQKVRIFGAKLRV